MDLGSKFTDIYKGNKWGSKESVSGWGSELRSTETLRNELPFLFLKYGIKSMLDIPCGDFNWMKEVNLKDIDYIGADIVKTVVDANKEKYPNIDFRTLDLTTDELPKVDLVFVRDCLGHLSDENIFKAINNIVRSNSKYLLTTSFTKYTSNPNIIDGNWKPISLMTHPYYLNPIYLINENCKEAYPHYIDKCMILVDLKNSHSKLK